MYKILNIFVILAILISLSSCNKEQQEIDERNAYLEENNITVSPTESGLYYIETEVGTGAQPQVEDIVTVHYTGKFLNGEVFDSSVDSTPIEFLLGAGRVIKGWDEGIALMKEGGKATLIIPSDLAYGENGSNSIPGYSTLIFEVELIEVKRSLK